MCGISAHRTTSSQERRGKCSSASVLPGDKGAQQHTPLEPSALTLHLTVSDGCFQIRHAEHSPGAPSFMGQWQGAGLAAATADLPRRSGGSSEALTNGEPGAGMPAPTGQGTRMSPCGTRGQAHSVSLQGTLERLGIFGVKWKAGQKQDV